MTMQTQCTLNETNDVFIDLYFYGLRINIQHMLAFKNFDNVDEIIQHAIKDEDIANYHHDHHQSFVPTMLGSDIRILFLHFYLS